MKTQTKFMFIAFFGYLFLGVAIYEVSHNRLPLTMTFNLILSLVSFVLSQYLFHHKEEKITIFVIFSFLLFVLFLPNNFYMITDLIHINSADFYYYQGSLRVYYKTLIPWITLFHLAGGVILAASLGATALSKVQKFIAYKKDAVLGHLVTFSISILCGYGVYLGRFIRLNSWDILKPDFIFIQLVVSLTWFGFFFSVFMGLVIYVLFWVFYLFKTEEIFG